LTLSGPPPRCLLVAHTFPPVLGGSAAVYAAVAEAAGGAITVLTSRRDHASGAERPGWREADAALPYRVHRIALVRPPLPAAAPRGRLRRQVMRAWRALALAVTVATLVRRQRIGAVCVCDDESTGWLIGFARRALGRTVAVWCHGDDLVETDPRTVRRRARQFRHADVVFAASRFARDRLTGAYGVAAGRIVLLANGVDAARFAPRPPPPGLPARYDLAGRRVILAASILVPRTAIDRLIAAMPAILARHPAACCLVVGDGPQAASLHALAQRLGVAGAVRFAGAVAPADMPAHYALADLVALPNRAEPGEADGIPLVLLEAAASGRPLIGGRAGGTPEVVVDGQTGLLVDGTDPAAIADAVCRLLDDAALRARLGAGARALAEAADWPSRTAAFLAALAAVSAASARPRRADGGAAPPSPRVSPDARTGVRQTPPARRQAAPPDGSARGQSGP
jgi:phosphatidylinositol alpha-1,6-mannosyltransferase